MSEVSGALTADEVRRKCFEKPPWGRRGYHEKSVNDLLQLVARRLDGRGYLCADDVRQIRFPKSPLFQRGYDRAEVDAFVDRLVEAVAALEGQPPQE
ncbi:DivIVA domain-containing protein [Mycolicibacterium thermoresistibile]